MCYLIVPERHKDGAYRFHGLFSNCDGMNIRDSGKKIKKKWEDSKGRKRFRRANGQIYRLGGIKAVRDSLRAGRYILKFITDNSNNYNPQCLYYRH